MVCGLAAATASMRASCPQGSVKVRSKPSLSVEGLKPTASTTMSAAAAYFLASSETRPCIHRRFPAQNEPPGEMGQIVGDEVDGLPGAEIDGGRLRNLALGVRLSQQLLAIELNGEGIFACCCGQYQIFAGFGCLVSRCVADTAAASCLRGPTFRASSRQWLPASWSQGCR